MKTATKQIKRKTKGIEESAVTKQYIAECLSVKIGNRLTIKKLDQEQYLEIPSTAFSLMEEILELLAEGKSIKIIPVETELTTQQAAQILNVSRPHVVKLLEDGIIPYRKTGTHRRILLKDLNKYEKKLAKKREKQLAFLTKQAQELGLGY
jgi:excisionase family DNA binding protein